MAPPAPATAIVPIIATGVELCHGSAQRRQCDCRGDVHQRAGRCGCNEPGRATWHVEAEGGDAECDQDELSAHVQGEHRDGFAGHDLDRADRGDAQPVPGAPAVLSEEREPRRPHPHEREQRGETGDRMSWPADERVGKSRR